MKLLLAGFLLLFWIGAQAADTMTLNVAKNQNEFSLSLPSNPTTGYQWVLVNYDRSFLKLITSQYLPSKSQLMGAGGQMHFRFKLISGKKYPAKTTMIYKYQRPWEPKKGTLKKVFINFKTGQS